MRHPLSGTHPVFRSLAILHVGVGNAAEHLDSANNDATRLDLDTLAGHFRNVQRLKGQAGKRRQLEAVEFLVEEVDVHHGAPVFELELGAHVEGVDGLRLESPLVHARHVGRPGRQQSQDRADQPGTVHIEAAGLVAPGIAAVNQVVAHLAGQPHRAGDFILVL